MNSQKCSNCNFVNFANAEICKRCKQNLHCLTQKIDFDKSSTVCPKCNSNDTQSFQMAYQTGTSKGRVQTTSYNGELGVSIGSANVSSQTVLASKIQPPIEPKHDTFLGGIIIVGVTWLFAIYIAANGSKMLGFIFGCLCTFLEIVFILAFYKRWARQASKAQDEYKSVIAIWLRSWICLRCGANWKV